MTLWFKADFILFVKFQEPFAVLISNINLCVLLDFATHLDKELKVMHQVLRLGNFHGREPHLVPSQVLLDDGRV